MDLTLDDYAYDDFDEDELEQELQRQLAQSSLAADDGGAAPSGSSPSQPHSVGFTTGEEEEVGEVSRLLRESRALDGTIDFSKVVGQLTAVDANGPALGGSGDIWNDFEQDRAVRESKANMLLSAVEETQKIAQSISVSDKADSRVTNEIREPSHIEKHGDQESDDEGVSDRMREILAARQAEIESRKAADKQREQARVDAQRKRQQAAEAAAAAAEQRKVEAEEAKAELEAKKARRIQQMEEQRQEMENWIKAPEEVKAKELKLMGNSRGGTSGIGKDDTLNGSIEDEDEAEEQAYQEKLRQEREELDRQQQERETKFKEQVKAREQIVKQEAQRIEEAREKIRQQRKLESDMASIICSHVVRKVLSRRQKQVRPASELLQRHARCSVSRHGYTSSISAALCIATCVRRAINNHQYTIRVGKAISSLRPPSIDCSVQSEGSSTPILDVVAQYWGNSTQWRTFGILPHSSLPFNTSLRESLEFLYQNFLANESNCTGTAWMGSEPDERLMLRESISEHDRSTMRVIHGEDLDPYDDESVALVSEAPESMCNLCLRLHQVLPEGAAAVLGAKVETVHSLKLRLPANTTALPSLRAFMHLRSLAVQNNNALRDMSQLSALLCLECLIVDSTKIESVSFAGKLLKLRHFSAKCCAISSPNFTELSSLQSLECLILASNPIVGIVDIPPLFKLCKLDISNCGIHGIKGLNGLPSLQSLSLFGTAMSTTPPPSIQCLKHLTMLFLSGCRLSQLPMLPDMPMLAVLNISDNSVASLEPFLWAPGLQSLDMSFNALSDPQSLASLWPLKRLENLRVNDNPLHQWNGYRQAALALVPSLRELDGVSVQELLTDTDPFIQAGLAGKESWSTSLRDTVMKQVAWHGSSRLGRVHASSALPVRLGSCAVMDSESLRYLLVRDGLERVSRGECDTLVTMERDSQCWESVQQQNNQDTQTKGLVRRPRRFWSLHNKRFQLHAASSSLILQAANRRLLVRHRLRPLGDKAAALRIYFKWKVSSMRRQRRALLQSAMWKGAVKIQSLWRGYWLRIRKARALAAAKLPDSDDELDEFDAILGSLPGPPEESKDSKFLPSEAWATFMAQQGLQADGPTQREPSAPNDVSLSHSSLPPISHAAQASGLRDLGNLSTPPLGEAAEGASRIPNMANYRPSSASFRPSTRGDEDVPDYLRQSAATAAAIGMHANAGSSVDQEMATMQSGHILGMQAASQVLQSHSQHSAVYNHVAAAATTGGVPSGSKPSGAVPPKPPGEAERLASEWNISNPMALKALKMRENKYKKIHNKQKFKEASSKAENRLAAFKRSAAATSHANGVVQTGRMPSHSKQRQGSSEFLPVNQPNLDDSQLSTSRSSSAGGDIQFFSSEAPNMKLARQRARAGSSGLSVENSPRLLRNNFMMSPSKK